MLYFESTFKDAESASAFHDRKAFTAAGARVADDSLVVTVSALGLMMIPICIYFIFFTTTTKCVCAPKFNEESTLHIFWLFMDGLKDFRSVLTIVNVTSPWKLYRVIHFLSLISGVAGIDCGCIVGME